MLGIVSRLVAFYTPDETQGFSIITICFEVDYGIEKNKSDSGSKLECNHAFYRCDGSNAIKESGLS